MPEQTNIFKYEACDGHCLSYVQLSNGTVSYYAITTGGLYPIRAINATSG